MTFLFIDIIPESDNIYQLSSFYKKVLHMCCKRYKNCATQGTLYRGADNLVEKNISTWFKSVHNEYYVQKYRLTCRQVILYCGGLPYALQDIQQHPLLPSSRCQQSILYGLNICALSPFPPKVSIFGGGIFGGIQVQIRS